MDLISSHESKDDILKRNALNVEKSAMLPAGTDIDSEKSAVAKNVVLISAKSNVSSNNIHPDKLTTDKWVRSSKTLVKRKAKCSAKNKDRKMMQANSVDADLLGPAKIEPTKAEKGDNKSVNTINKEFDYPVLRALSSEKVEDVVVIADVDTINAKFPKNLEPDGELGTTLSSSEDESLTKYQIPFNDFQQNLKTKKAILLQQAFNLSKKQLISSKSSNFGNPKHLELLQNLMKNKNIVVQKRAAATSIESMIGKNLLISSKSLRKRDMNFPYDFKIAQLWKEWEEVNKRIPQVPHKTFQSKIEKQPIRKDKDNFISSSALEELKNKESPSRTEESNSRVVFEKNDEQNKNEEDSKLKWKVEKDTVYCKDCRIFLLKSSYNNHIKFVHEKVRKYLCQTCGYAACTGTILRQHVQAVHVGYSFFCDQCPKKFNLMKRLRKHIELHHSGKPIERNHICQYCGMAFVKPGCLKRHLRSHTQETPYECQFCQRRFKYRWPKVQHERLHTGEKPYKCSFCEERFTQNCVRKAHEYKKHGNEEYKPKARTVKEENSAGQILKIEKEDSEISSRASFHSGSEST